VKNCYAASSGPLASAITPTKKRKGFEDSVPGMGASPTPSLTGTLSNDSDGLVILESNSSEDASTEAKVDSITCQWDNMVGCINNLTTALKRFKTDVVKEFDTLDDRVTGVDARIGQPEELSSFADCLTAWDGLLKVHGMINDKFDSGVEDNATKLSELGESTKQSLEVVNKNINDIATVIKILNDEQAVIGAHVQVNAPAVSEAAFRELQTDVRNLRAAAITPV
jgi:hypothetical protein